jgi:hypothetical protein
MAETTVLIGEMRLAPITIPSMLSVNLRFHGVPDYVFTLSGSSCIVSTQFRFRTLATRSSVSFVKPLFHLAIALYHLARR